MSEERRVFKVDVSEMSKQEAEQYIDNLKNYYRNRMSYKDSSEFIEGIGKGGKKIYRMNVLTNWLIGIAVAVNISAVILVFVLAN